MLQFPVERQVTTEEPEWTRPGSQEYITSPPTTVLEGVPGDPSSMEGRGPQAISRNESYVVNTSLIIIIIIIITMFNYQYW